MDRHWSFSDPTRQLLGAQEVKCAGEYVGLILILFLVGVVWPPPNEISDVEIQISSLACTGK